jgi:hypothetical protein
MGPMSLMVVLWEDIIVIMSFFWGAVTGSLIGVYFAEKDVPFPLSYHSGPNKSAGQLVLDLQIGNVIVNDIRAAFGFAPIAQTPAAPK